MAGREHGQLFQVVPDFAGQGIDLTQPFDLIAEQLDTHGRISIACWEDLDHVAVDPEGAAVKVKLVAVILHIHQAAQYSFPLHRHPVIQHHRQVQVISRIAQAIDGGNGGNDQHVAASQQRRGRRMTQLFYLVVYRGIFGDIGIAGSYIGFRLVIIVIGYEILNRVFREELLEFSEQLRGQGLIVGDDQSGAVEPSDDVSHSEGLAGTGNAQQHLISQTFFHSPDQFFYCLGLVSGGSVIAMQFEGALGAYDLVHAFSFRLFSIAHFVPK